MIELMIVMVIVMVVMMISSGAFENAAKFSVAQRSSSDSNIQGIIGLETMRQDLEHAGYGLPWPSPDGGSFVYNYSESNLPANGLANGVDPKAFNNANSNGKPKKSADPFNVPRAVESASSNAGGPWEKGRDYLVIRGTWLGGSATAKRWSYLDGLGSASSIKQWGNPTDDLAVGDWVVTLKQTTADHKTYRDLVGTGNNFSYQVPAPTSGKYVPAPGFQPDTNDVFLAYGVSDTAPRYPYNRVDYFVRRPSDDPSVEPGMSSRCAPGTGILYKANVIHNVGHVNPNRNAGGVDQYPLLECVADMQVVYSLDTNGDGAVDMHEDEDILSNLSAEDIRNELKEVRVYILTHEGGYDKSYNYPSSTVWVGYQGKDGWRGRAYDLSNLDKIGTNWRNYRWKVYTLVVEPKNINN